MEKRVILAIGLCVAVMIAWTKFFPVRPPTPAPVAQTAPAATPEAAKPAVGGGPSVPSGAPAGAPIANRPEQKVELDTPDVRFVFSSRGATLQHAELRNTKFRDRPQDAASGHDLVATSEPQEAPLRTTFPKSGFPEPADGS